MRRLSLLLSPFLLAPFLLAGAAALCGCTDPYQREGTWHATGVNEDNLRALVADPADLERGVSGRGTDGQLAAAAVARFRAGQVKSPESDSIAKIGSGTGGGQAAPAASSAGGS
jgi:hypothetical protein